MKVFNGIVGVVSIFGALYCIFWENSSFLNCGWIVTLVLLLLGICSVATYVIDRKEQREKDPEIVVSGTAGLVCGIAVCVLSILSYFSAAIQILFMLLVFIVFVVYLVVAGIKDIAAAVKRKNSDNPKGWGVSMALGIVVMLAGAYGLIGGVALGGLNGVNLGIMLAVFGCTLIASVFKQDDVARYDNI